MHHGLSGIIRYNLSKKNSFPGMALGGAINVDKHKSIWALNIKSCGRILTFWAIPSIQEMILRYDSWVVLSPLLLSEWVKSLSRVQLFVTPWTIAYQAPLSMEFSRQEYWSGLPFPSPGDLPNPGIKPRSPALQADDLPSEPPGHCS